MIKGNKGEWSEFYTFLKILSDRKLFAADSELNRIPDKFYDVLKVIREEAKAGTRIYDISVYDQLVVITDSSGHCYGKIPMEQIRTKISYILKAIKSKEGTTFEIPLASEVMEELNCTQIKAVNNEKADIFVVIRDRISPMLPKLGFSIKSMIGSPSTLLNASRATNFIYEINNLNCTINELNKIDTKSKLRDRMDEILKHCDDLKFLGVEDDTFRQNLRKLETRLPEMIAEIVSVYYKGKGANLQMLINELEKEGVIKRKFDLSKNDFEYKIKEFLSAIALGMTPTKIWDGKTIAHGGYIVVKENGEIVCYHLYNRDEFLTYLLKNVKLETPSTGRHKFGDVYEEGSKIFIKLNLQVRFLR